MRLLVKILKASGCGSSRWRITGLVTVHAHQFRGSGRQMISPDRLLGYQILSPLRGGGLLLLWEKRSVPLVRDHFNQTWEELAGDGLVEDQGKEGGWMGAARAKPLC